MEKKIPRARDERAIPRGQWAPVGKNAALVRCPACGTGFAVALDARGEELYCPKEGCPFFCTTADLEHFEGVEGGNG